MIGCQGGDIIADDAAGLAMGFLGHQRLVCFGVGGCGLPMDSGGSGAPQPP